MHQGQIEDYYFSHGLHRNLISGKWFPLHPHQLGRPLTHPEMDYNLLYTQQTMAGWRIAGRNSDLTLIDDELELSLIYHKIDPSDTNYQTWVDNGYQTGQYIWITPIYNCGTFMITETRVTDPTGDYCEFFALESYSSTGSTGLVCPDFEIEDTEVIPPSGFTPEFNLTLGLQQISEEGPDSSLDTTQYFDIILSTEYVLPGTTVGYTITGDWGTNTDGSTDIEVIGQSIGGETSTPSPTSDLPPNSPYTGTFTVGVDGLAAIKVYAVNDTVVEGAENILVQLDEYDSVGYLTGTPAVQGEIISNDV
tara:strand:- start:4049 stop:4969 length:921 start_codon:yes stop_codon:yes gene_type:complete